MEPMPEMLPPARRHVGVQYHMVGEIIKPISLRNFGTQTDRLYLCDMGVQYEEEEVIEMPHPEQPP